MRVSPPRRSSRGPVPSHLQSTASIIAGSLNVNSMRSSSFAEPTTSAAASGNSSVTDTTTWETPLRAHQLGDLAHALVDARQDQVRRVRALGVEDVAGVRTGRGRDEAVAAHPVVVEDLRDVAPSRIGHEDDDARTLGCALAPRSTPRRPRCRPSRRSASPLRG